MSRIFSLPLLLTIALLPLACEDADTPPATAQAIARIQTHTPSRKVMWTLGSDVEVVVLDASGQPLQSASLSYAGYEPRAFRNDRILFQDGDDVLVMQIDDDLNIVHTGSFNLPAELSGYQAFALERSFTSGAQLEAQDHLWSAWQDPDSGKIRLLLLRGGYLPDFAQQRDVPGRATATPCLFGDGGTAVDLARGDDGLYRLLVQTPAGLARIETLVLEGEWLSPYRGELLCEGAVPPIEHNLRSWGLSNGYRPTSLGVIHGELHMTYGGSQVLDFGLDEKNDLLWLTFPTHGAYDRLRLDSSRAVSATFRETGTLDLSLSNLELGCGGPSLTTCDDWHLQLVVPIEAKEGGTWPASGTITVIDHCGLPDGDAGGHPYTPPQTSHPVTAFVTTSSYGPQAWSGEVSITSASAAADLPFVASSCTAPD